MGLDIVCFSGCVWNFFFKAEHNSEIWPVGWTCHDIFIGSFSPVLCGSGTLERVQIFSLVQGLKIRLQGIFKQRSRLMQSFVETCVDVDVAHLAVNFVPRSLCRSVLPEWRLVQSICNHVIDFL